VRCSDNALYSPPHHTAYQAQRLFSRRRAVINARYNVAMYVGVEKKFMIVGALASKKVKHAQ
jgi:hypothetical protein